MTALGEDAMYFLQHNIRQTLININMTLQYIHYFTLLKKLKLFKDIYNTTNESRVALFFGSG